MNSYILALSLVAKVMADWDGDMSKVQSAASGLGSKVDGWSKDDGLQGALGIQQDFPNLSEAVGALSKDSSSISADDIDPDKVNSFVGSVVKLLDGLTKKADDLKSTGASQIVSNDLKSLGQPAADIVSNIVKVASSDCDKIDKLTEALGKISGGFKSANSAYDAPSVEFPDAPKCNGGGGGSDSKSASGSGSASHTGGSGSGSGKPSGSGSGKPTGSDSASGSPTPKPSSKPSGSGSGGSPPIANNGYKAAAGTGMAAGAFALALLI